MDEIGDENFLSNTTSYKFDDNNQITFSKKKQKNKFN